MDSNWIMSSQKCAPKRDNSDTETEQTGKKAQTGAGPSQTETKDQMHSDQVAGHSQNDGNLTSKYCPPPNGISEAMWEVSCWPTTTHSPYYRPHSTTFVGAGRPSLISALALSAVCFAPNRPNWHLANSLDSLIINLIEPTCPRL